MGGEHAPAHRSGDHAGEVQDADAGERPFARREPPRRRIVDPLDGKYRQRGERAPLRVRVPFGERAAHGHDQPRLRRRRLERFALPAIERALHGRALMLAAEQPENAVAVVRKIGVQPHPAAVAAAIEAENLVLVLRGRSPPTRI